MAHAEGSVKINAPLEKVYAFVADGTQNQKWRPSVMDIALASGQPGTVGATYKQGLKGPGGRRMDGDYTITDYVPNKSLSFQVIAGPAHPRGRFELEPEEGGTRLKFELDLETKGVQKLLDPVIAATMRKEVEALGNLKRYLESPSQA
jgi:uncharacterized protein YndB with AHSA1/START domain